jgi:ATP-dependent DNA helicase RecG
MSLLIQTPTQLAPHLRALRIVKGWSQAQLGVKLSLSQARIARIEKDPLNVSVGQLLKVLNALDAKISVLVERPNMDDAGPTAGEGVNVASATGNVNADKSNQGNWYPIKPVACKGRYFKRVGNANHQMTATEISDAHIKLINSSWDYHPDPEHPLASISEAKVKAFADAVHLNATCDAVLEKFELVKLGRPTFACHLLFSKNDVFLSTIEAGRFASPTVIKDSITSLDTLIEQVQRIMDFMVKHTNKAYIITGNPKREERWDYPMDALREIIINMIVHRDYRSANDSTIKVFDDRIEFFNPGTLLDDLTVEKIKTGNYKSHLRNKQIASIFRELDLIEKYGSGVRRVIDIFTAYGLPEPTFEATQGGMAVTVFNRSLQAKEIGKDGGVNGGANGGVNGGVISATEQLHRYIEGNPGLNTATLVEQTGAPKRTLERWLQQLKAQGLVEFRGAPKTGGYHATVSNAAAPRQEGTP